MAYLPALVDMLAERDGRLRGSVDHVARALRDAGLIHTAKRGRGAAPMTALDAAALIIGLYGVPDASPDSVADASRLISMKRRGKVIRQGTPFGEFDPLPSTLRPITSSKTLGEAVAALIELAPLIRSRPDKQPANNLFDVMLQLGRPRMRGLIKISWTGHDNNTQGVQISFSETDSSHKEHLYAVEVTINSMCFIALHQTLFLLE